MASEYESIRAVGWKKWVSFLLREKLIASKSQQYCDIHPAQLFLFTLPSASVQTCYSCPQAPGAGPVCPEEAYQIVW